MSDSTSMRARSLLHGDSVCVGTVRRLFGSNETEDVWWTIWQAVHHRDAHTVSVVFSNGQQRSYPEDEWVRVWR